MLTIKKCTRTGVSVRRPIIELGVKHKIETTARPPICNGNEMC